MEMSPEYKGIGKSVTVWGAMATLLVGLFGTFGVPLESESLVKGLEAGALAVSTAVTIWGRVRAEKRIG